MNKTQKTNLSRNAGQACLNIGILTTSGLLVGSSVTDFPTWQLLAGGISTVVFLTSGLWLTINNKGDTL
jgi:hypothetical protein